MPTDLRQPRFNFFPLPGDPLGPDCDGNEEGHLDSEEKDSRNRTGISFASAMLWFSLEEEKTMLRTIERLSVFLFAVLHCCAVAGPDLPQ